jgi:hypothetical protein
MKRETILKGNLTISLSDEQKRLVDIELERIENDTDYLLDWNTVKHKLNKDFFISNKTRIQ